MKPNLQNAIRKKSLSKTISYNSAKRAIQIVKKSFQIKDINVRVSEVSSFDGFIYLTLGALVPWDTVIGRRTTFPLVKDARIKGLPYTKWVTLLVRFQVLSNRKLANNFYSFQKVKNENKKHNNKKRCTRLSESLSFSYAVFHVLLRQ